MKKLALIFSAAIFFALFSCSDTKSSTSDRAKKNLENTKAVTKMFESRDFSKLGDHIAADATDHAAWGGPVKGLDSLKALFEKYSSMTSDSKNEIVKEFADDDYSMVWLKQTWTAKVDDPMMGMKAGDKGTAESIEVCKHNAEGKITDHWSFMSMNDVMKMMPPMATDTTHKMIRDTVR